jgi:hypothetical protein
MLSFGSGDIDLLRSVIGPAVQPLPSFLACSCVSYCSRSYQCCEQVLCMCSSKFQVSNFRAHFVIRNSYVCAPIRVPSFELALCRSKDFFLDTLVIS